MSFTLGFADVGNTAPSNHSFTQFGCGCPCHNGLLWGGQQPMSCWCNCHSKVPVMRLAIDNELRGDVEALKREVHVLRETIEKTARRRPHACPVCQGVGFTHTSGERQECLPCDTKGIIWG